MSDPAVPVVLLTGALGSGKSTLLKALLAEPAMADTALVINEFGAVGLDHLLVSSAVESTLLLDNGCICCSLRGDLVDTLAGLMDRRDAGALAPFRRIVVETTGLADPEPIVRELAAARNLTDRVRLRRVATAVDAALGIEALSEAGVSQIVQADDLIVTKADLAPPIAVDRLCERLAGMNPAATVRIASGGRLDDPAALFAPAGVAARAAAGPRHGHGHGDVESWSVRLERPLPWALVGAWLERLYSLRPGQLLRMKGVVWTTESDLPVLTQAVGPLIAPVELMAGWPGGVRETRLVVIARGLSATAIGESFDAEVLTRAGAAAARRAAGA